MDKPHSEKVYVDLDCLLDTRLGTLAKISDECAVQALQSNYHKRQIDSFPNVDTIAFRELYKQRDTETLALSVATNAFVLLQACVKGSLEDIALGGQNEGIIFEVNYYPYELDDEEKKLIRLSILSRTLDTMDVELISIDNKFLTPAYCNENYAMMIRYDYVDWFEMHLEQLEKTPIPKMALIVPSLYRNEIPNAEKLDEFKRNHINPFRATEISAAPVVGLKFLGVDVFCIDSDIKPGKPKSSGL